MRYRHQINLMKNGMKQEVAQKVVVEQAVDTPEALERDRALLSAFMKEDIEEVKRLLRSENGVRGANANVLDEAGRSLSHLAHRWGWKEMKGVLRKHGGRIICRGTSIHPNSVQQIKQAERN